MEIFLFICFIIAVICISSHAKKCEEVNSQDKREEDTINLRDLPNADVIRYFSNQKGKLIYPRRSVHDDVVYDTSCKLINWRSSIFLANEHEHSNVPYAGWRFLNDIPYYYFYYYVPKNCPDRITGESRFIRNVIYNFKSGKCSLIKYRLEAKLIDTFLGDLNYFVFVCIPASTKEKTRSRFKFFSESVCDDLGMLNGYDHLSLSMEKTSKHLGGDKKLMLDFDCAFFKNKTVVLFDDIVTTGNSMLQVSNRLKKIGANIICQISLGKTYNGRYLTNSVTHPWSGGNVFDVIK